jgi:beta-glucosidase
MTNRPFFFVSLVFLIGLTPSVTVGQDASVDERARQTEAQMTDDERFGMIYSVLGAATVIGMKPDSRIPKGVPMSAGYAQGVPRLGVPAQLQTDASMGVTVNGQLN